MIKLKCDYDTESLNNIFLDINNRETRANCFGTFNISIHDRGNTFYSNKEGFKRRQTN